MANLALLTRTPPPPYPLRFDHATFANYSDLVGQCQMASFVRSPECAEWTIEDPGELRGHPCVNASANVRERECQNCTVMYVLGSTRNAVQ